MKSSLHYHWHQGLDYTSLWIRGQSAAHKLEEGRKGGRLDGGSEGKGREDEEEEEEG